MRKAEAGIRYFSCEEEEEDFGCGHRWSEETRDAPSPSGEYCPKCGDFVHPFEYRIYKDTGE